MVSAGNSAVMCPHPNAKKTAAATISLLNRAIVRHGGPANLLSSCKEATVEYTEEIMRHKEVQIILVTGGPSAVRAAFQSGKRAICAGPGNPPVLVDGTTNLAKTAKFIADGNSFENCLNCIGEKELFVLENVADTLIEQLVLQGCYWIRDKETIGRLMNLVTEDNGTIKKKYIGKDARILLRDLGIDAGKECKTIIFEVPCEHPAVLEEYLMPLLPIVRVKSIEQGIEYAVCAEGGRHHSSVVHSSNVETITQYSNALRTTVLTINGSSFNGVGMAGEGFVTMSIATTTGEGLTCPSVFTRVIRKTVVNGLSQYVINK
jgi:propionaldehyde dehydrogenase